MKTIKQAILEIRNDLDSISPLHFSRAICLSAAVLLTACGGGSGTSAQSSATAVEIAQATKTRSLYVGFDVKVTPYVSDATSNIPTRVDVKVNSIGQVINVVAVVGKDYETGVQAEVTETAPGSAWSIKIPPGATADSALLLSFNLASGDVYETGLTDFQFK